MSDWGSSNTETKCIVVRFHYHSQVRSARIPRVNDSDLRSFGVTHCRHPNQICSSFSSQGFLGHQQLPTRITNWKKHAVHHVHPSSLTWNLKITLWKRRFRTWKPIIFRFHVKLWGVYPKWADAPSRAIMNRSWIKRYYQKLGEQKIEKNQCIAGSCFKSSKKHHLQGPKKPVISGIAVLSCNSYK